MNKTTIKEVAEVTIGSFQVTLDEEKMGILDDACNHTAREYQQIQEMTDWLIDLCCDGGFTDEQCLKYIKYLKNIRGSFDYLKTLGVTTIDVER